MWVGCSSWRSLTAFPSWYCFPLFVGPKVWIVVHCDRLCRLIVCLVSAIFFNMPLDVHSCLWLQLFWSTWFLFMAHFGLHRSSVFCSWSWLSCYVVVSFWYSFCHSSHLGRCRGHYCHMFRYVITLYVHQLSCCFLFFGLDGVSAFVQDPWPFRCFVFPWLALGFFIATIVVSNIRIWLFFLHVTLLRVVLDILSVSVGLWCLQLYPFVQRGSYPVSFPSLIWNCVILRIVVESRLSRFGSHCFVICFEYVMSVVFYGSTLMV